MVYFLISTMEKRYMKDIIEQFLTLNVARTDAYIKFHREDSSIAIRELMILDPCRSNVRVWELQTSVHNRK